MPSLVYNQQTDVSPALASPDAQGAHFTPAVGEAVEQLGHEGSQLAADYNRINYMRQHANDVTTLMNNLGQGQMDLEKIGDDVKQKVGPSGVGYTDTMMEQKFKPWAQQVLDQQTNPQVKQMAARQLKTMELALFHESRNWETGTTRAWRVSSIDGRINSSASLVSQDPSVYEPMLNDTVDAIKSIAGLHPMDAFNMEMKARGSFAEAAALSDVQRDPRGTAAMLMGEQPLPQGSVQGQIAAAAASAGIDPKIALGIVSRETGGTFSPTIKNAAGSSAYGLFQQTDDNWKQYAPPGANPSDPAAQIAGGIQYTRDNIAGLKKTLGRDPTPGEILAAHQFGLGGARALLKAPDAMPFSSLVAQYDPKNAAATVQQNALGGMTVGDVKASMDKQMASHMAQSAGYANAPPEGEPPNIAGMPPYFQALTPQGRQALLAHAQTLMHKDNSEAKMTLQARIRDTMSAWQNGEDAKNPPSLQDYMALYPASEATRMYSDQVGWQQFGADVGAGKGLPYAEQQALLDARQKSLVPGTDGYAEGVQRLNQLSQAFTHIDLQREHDQIKTAATLGGINVQQLDFSSPQALVGKLQVRAIQADQIAKQYNLPYKPFQNDEALQLGQILDKAPAPQARQYLQIISQQMDTPDHYAAAMRQLAPNNPVTAVAGQLAQNWVPGQPDAASIILTGDRILNPDKGDKAAEGKHTKIPMPEIGGSKGLRQLWETQVGQAYGSNQKSSEQDFNAALAYYAGRIPPGEQSEVLNQKVWDEAVNTVAPHTTYAGRDVLIPQGSDVNRFSDSVAAIWPQVMAAHGLDPKDYPANAYPLTSLPDGSYAVSDGTSTLYGKDGTPVRFNLTSGAIQPTSDQADVPDRMMPKKPDFPKMASKTYRLK